KVGHITNAVRNIASEMITALGGAVAVPSAVRSSESTTTMRVNDVTITRIEGASDRIVSSAISCSTRSVRPVPWPKLMEISCAAAGVASTAASASRLTGRAQRRKRWIKAGASANQSIALGDPL